MNQFEHKAAIFIRRPMLGFAATAFALAASLVCGSISFAAPPPSVTVKIDTGPTTTGGIPGDTTGDAVHYQYTVIAGSAIHDVLPIKICIITPPSDAIGWTSFAIHVGVLGQGSLPGVGATPALTLPGDIAFNIGDGCKTTSIAIDTAALAAGNYATNVNMTVVNKSPGNMQVGLNTGTQTIHFTAASYPYEPTTNLSCFLTDSEGNVLFDKNGDPVTQSGSSAGVFAINVNKKNTEVATNPGQFYYNMVWRNISGSGKAPTADFDLVGAAPHGAQALHSAVYPNFPNPVVALTEFEATNELGLPKGQFGPVSAPYSVNNPTGVPNGSSWMVTYHLEWSGIGGPAPSNIGLTPATANQILSVTGTVIGVGIVPSPDTCTALAKGYKK